jgi:hypothetical protein
VQESAMESDELTLGTAIRMSFYDVVIGFSKNRVLPAVETIALAWRKSHCEDTPLVHYVKNWGVAGGGWRWAVALACEVGGSMAEPRCHSAWSTLSPSHAPGARSCYGGASSGRTAHGVCLLRGTRSEASRESSEHIEPPPAAPSRPVNSGWVGSRSSRCLHLSY